MSPQLIGPGFEARRRPRDLAEHLEFCAEPHCCLDAHRAEILKLLAVIDDAMILYKYVCSQCSLVQFYAEDDRYPNYRRSLRCPNSCVQVGKHFHNAITLDPYGPVEFGKMR